MFHYQVERDFYLHTCILLVIMRTTVNNPSSTDDALNVRTAAVSSKNRYTIYHLSTFLLTFVRQAEKKDFLVCWNSRRVYFSSYAMLHAARKVFSNVKSTIAEEWSPLANETSHPISPANVTKIDLSVS